MLLPIARLYNCPRYDASSFALCHPCLDLGSKLVVWQAVLQLEPDVSKVVADTYGTLLNGSLSDESNAVRILDRSMTTRDTGKMTGSFITGISVTTIGPTSREQRIWRQSLDIPNTHRGIRRGFHVRLQS